jgi:hypothetical protein
MKFLRIRKSQTRATVQVDLTHIIKDPILGIDENLRKFKSSIEDAIKSHASKLALHCYPHVEHSIDSHFLSIEFKDYFVLKEFINILQSINNNSDKIYQNLISSPYMNEDKSMNIQAFKENVYISMLDEIVEYKKRQSLTFINIEKTPHSLKIIPNFQDIVFINYFIGARVKMCFMDCITQQLNNYAGTYHPNENIIISSNEDKLPHILITSNNTDAISYLSNFFKKLNNQSNEIYDIATTDLHISYSQKETALNTGFNNLFNGFFVREVMNDHLPINNNTSTKRVKL